MINIAVTGFPGSRHSVISKELAARLDIDYASAYKFAREWCDTHDINYHLYKYHNYTDGDAYVDTNIDAFVQAHIRNHDVVDCIRALDIPNHVTVYIESELIDTAEFAKALYEEADQEKKLFSDIDIYCAPKYNFSFPNIYMPVDSIVSTVVRCFANGNFEGHYLHPFMLLPLKDLPTNCIVCPEIAEHEVFKVVKCVHGYYLIDVTQYGSYLWHLRHAKPVQVKLLDDTLSYNQLLPFERYTWLSKFVNSNIFLRLELVHRLSRYARRYAVKDTNQLYIDLSRNQNALRILREGNY